MLRAAYDYLRTLPPFNRWNLPADITLRVTNSREEFGSYDNPGGEHQIAISRKLVTTGQGLLCVMAHEVIHLHQRIAGTENSTSQHNRLYRQIAKRVCSAMGYESRGFV
jgi:hypothetical protein